VEAGGVETHSEENKNLTNKGQILSTAEQVITQSAINEKDINNANVDNRTKSDHDEAFVGHTKTTFGAQQEHNRNITELTENEDLKKIIEAWGNLPEALRQGILAMIEAVSKN